jgi:hypothetical protein
VVESFMNREEEYMQTSFQTTGDEGMMRDDSHQFCRGIKFEGRKGKVFTCSTTVLANSGLVSNCRIRFTKSHQEIREVFQQLRLVRENDGCTNCFALLEITLTPIERKWSGCSLHFSIMLSRTGQCLKICLGLQSI